MTTQGTHHADCWRDHHACAVARVETLTALLSRWYDEYGGSTWGSGNKRCDEALDNETAAPPTINEGGQDAATREDAGPVASGLMAPVPPLPDDEGDYFAEYTKSHGWISTLGDHTIGQGSSYAIAQSDGFRVFVLGNDEDARVLSRAPYVYKQYAAWKAIAIEQTDAITRLTAKLAEARNLCETLRNEAQIHAQEARTANATIAEIYRACTGGTGEPGNWHGARPVIAALERLTAELAEARAECERLRAANLEKRSALQELRIRLHASGRRPEECYEMSLIDNAISAERKP